MWQPFVVIIIVLSLGVSSAIRAELRPRDVEYIATEYNADGEPVTFGYNSGQATDIALDARRRLVYSVGGDRLTVLKVRRDKTLDLLHTETFDGFTISSIQSCKGFVTITMNKAPNFEGRLLVFRRYNKRSTGNLEMLHSLPVGILSEHHAITRNCRRILVANTAHDGGIEPEGTMSVITFGGSKFRSPVVKTLSFLEFANQQRVLESESFFFVKGRFDLEPTWVCLNKKETKAYVALRGNNGLAVVDFTPRRERVVKLKGLGLKDWSVEGGTQGFDGSRTPREAILRNAPIFATYNAQQISCQTIGKQDYIFLAGKGLGTPDSSRLSTVQFQGFPGSTDPELFGDLNVYDLSPLTDTNDDGEIDRIVTIGSRSFAVVCGTDFTIAADTGSELELLTMNSFVYNSQPFGSGTLIGAFDARSTTTGPQPESIVTKRVCRGRYILMIGSAERPGHLFVYTLDTRNIKAGFVFQDRVDGYSRTDSVFTNGQLYDARQISLQDPEGLVILGHSSRGGLMLVSASRRTSTVELFDIRINCQAESP